MKTVKSSRLTLMALPIALVTANAEARVGSICLELPRASSTLSAEVHSGCLPTSPNYRGQVTLQANQTRAEIRIDGGFEQSGGFHIGTTDCMGSRVLSYQAEDVQPRRYSVLINGQFAGVLDASAGHGEAQCFNGPQSRISDNGESIRRSNFEAWSVAEPDQIASFSAPTIGALIAPILGNHPESLEGRASASVTVQRASWEKRSPFVHRHPGAFYAVRVEEHGYADDSVSGRRSFAEVRQTEDGNWRVVSLWSQWMCARGEKAGQWSGAPCP